MSRAADTELLSFATDFWAVFGARLEREKEGGLLSGVYRVELPEALAAHFGKRRIAFALTARDAWASGAEILAPGSHLIEQMYAYVRPRAVRSAYRLAALPDATPGRVKQEVLRRVDVGNAELLAVSSAEVWPALLAVDFKLVFETDVREEELVRIVEGLSGQMSIARVEPRAPWAGAQEAGTDVAGKLWLPDVEERYGRLCDAARQAAIERSRAFEEEAVARLSESLARLRGYFTQIKAEVAGDVERRNERLAELGSEEARKVEEEVETHRVRVKVVPLCIAILGIPTRRVGLRFRDAQGNEARLECDWDLARGTVESSSFGVIPVEGAKLLMCCAAHLCHAREGRSCRGCSRTICETHAAACATCGAPTCDACASRCTLCGQRTCPDHLPAPCRVCGKKVCAGCARSCVTCDEGAVAGGPAAASSSLCRDDALVCGVCGRSSCPDHAVRCACGQIVCRDDVVVDAVSQIRYCGRCAIVCADCRRPIGRATSLLCATCGQRLCRDDARSCAVCVSSPAAARGGASPALAARLCREHRARCNACGHDLCRARHRKRCRLCARDLCAGCLDAAQRCALCLELFRDRKPAPPPPLVPPEAEGCREWRHRAGADHDLYLGKSRDRTLLVVVDKLGAVVKVWER